MPIYEYRCDECHQLFETWCKHVEENDVPHACPICKGQSRRIISNTSFALKGGGWYATEYGSRSKEGKASGGDCAGSGAGKESAPACESAASCQKAEASVETAGTQT